MKHCIVHSKSANKSSAYVQVKNNVETVRYTCRSYGGVLDIFGTNMYTVGPLNLGIQSYN